MATHHRRIALAAALVLIAAAVVPALAAESAPTVSKTGWIVDEWCGAGNAGPEGAACARSCAEKGSDLVLYSEGTLYKLSDKKLAMKHIGHQVTVTGTIDDNGVFTVTTIEKAEDDA